MREIIIGTSNPAKFEQIKGALAPLEIKVRGIPEGAVLPEVVEDGTVEENSRKKAVTYAKALGATVLSVDNALYLEGLEPEKQPGINVRRIGGRKDRPTDEELIDYYSRLVLKLGGRAGGRWEFAVCIATPAGDYEEVVIAETSRVFVGTPSETRIQGYPLESLQISPESGRYTAEMTAEEKALFWQRAIGTSLMDFVRRSKLI
ncbi:hypothetical protein A3K55_01615 [Candidatus Shapirobacteria bacterium RBG_13_44_7]|uniref:Non-canonical purine NTP pyrophosphatase n=1 Tax=Candidatus Shapirobacteria bacterium RBG_13_44_7 TaxID=1802149 RepID=A0A1F7SJC0_9BACT|nr:MAG: hypothetical protein A3K55_01615 [Candidatus Shapirobacteria bacterium RBG_13_44_7]